MITTLSRSSLGPAKILTVSNKKDDDMSANNPTQKKRAHLGIHFQCCNVYGYIYKNKENTAYTGRCPRCGRPLKVKVSHDGTGSPQRIFQAK